MTLLTSIFTNDVVAQQLSDEQFLAYMLDFEVALARVQAQMDMIPAQTLKRMLDVASEFEADFPAMYKEMEQSSVPTIAFIKQLRQAVGREYGSYVHWGATTQDVMDTALVLQLRPIITEIEMQLNDTMQNLVRLAEEHRNTIMAGRTHSQQALPITFGFKLAHWLSPLIRHKQRLTELKPRLLVLQFGGAVGTLASLGENGLVVAKQLATELDLNMPATSWHTQRDNLAEFANWLSLVTGSLAKMAQDIILMAQSEIGEVLESDDPSRGGSSTMPQKRNPIISEIIIACARQNATLLASAHQTMIQEHERATGNWQLEWQTLPQMLHLTMTALNKSLFLSQHLVVNSEQMQANVTASNGLMLAEAIELALAPHIGRNEAKDIIKTCVSMVIKDKRHLVDVVRERADVDLDWNLLRSEANYLGCAHEFMNRVLDQFNSVI